MGRVEDPDKRKGENAVLPKTNNISSSPPVSKVNNSVEDGDASKKRKNDSRVSKEKPKASKRDWATTFGLSVAAGILWGAVTGLDAGTFAAGFFTLNAAYMILQGMPLYKGL